MTAPKNPTSYRSWTRYSHKKGGTGFNYTPRGGDDEYYVRYCYTCGDRTEHDVCTKRCVNHPGW